MSQRPLAACAAASIVLFSAPRLASAADDCVAGTQGTIAETYVYAVDDVSDAGTVTEYYRVQNVQLSATDHSLEIWRLPAGSPTDGTGWSCVARLPVNHQKAWSWLAPAIATPGQDAPLVDLFGQAIGSAGEYLRVNLETGAVVDGPSPVSSPAPQTFSGGLFETQGANGHVALHYLDITQTPPAVIDLVFPTEGCADDGGWRADYHGTFLAVSCRDHVQLLHDGDLVGSPIPIDGMGQTGDLDALGGYPAATIWSTGYDLVVARPGNDALLLHHIALGQTLNPTGSDGVLVPAPGGGSGVLLVPQRRNGTGFTDVFFENTGGTNPLLAVPGAIESGVLHTTGLASVELDYCTNTGSRPALLGASNDLVVFDAGTPVTSCGDAKGFRKQFAAARIGEGGDFALDDALLMMTPLSGFDGPNGEPFVLFQYHAAVISFPEAWLP